MKMYRPQTSTTTVNLIKDSGFDNADFESIDAEPYLYGEWLTYKDAKENECYFMIQQMTGESKVGSLKPYIRILHFAKEIVLKRIYKLLWENQHRWEVKLKFYSFNFIANEKDAEILY